MGKYDPLYEYLNNSNANSVVLTFRSVEKIIKNNLPDRAKTDQLWWEGETINSSKYIQCNAWIKAGYIAQVNLRKQEVQFIKKSIDILDKKDFSVNNNDYLDNGKPFTSQVNDSSNNINANNYTYMTNKTTNDSIVKNGYVYYARRCVYCDTFISPLSTNCPNCMRYRMLYKAKITNKGNSSSPTKRKVFKKRKLCKREIKDLCMIIVYIILMLAFLLYDLLKSKWFKYLKKWCLYN